MKTLENNAVILKDLSMADVKDVYEYTQNKEVALNAGWEPHKSLDETKQVLDTLIKSNEVWGIYHKTDDKLIGTIGVHFGKYPLTSTKVYSLGFVLNPKYWGQGIMRKSCDLVIAQTFNEKDIHEMYANHFAFNTRSHRFMKKYGMEFVGRWMSKKNDRENNLFKITRDGFFNNHPIDQ
jgi:RimJ/RimL family protein N-acetyltransferase